MADGKKSEEAAGETVQQSIPEKKRDLWEKVDILGRPFSAFLTAIVVALIGWFGQQALQDQQRAITERAASEQSTRLYTELLSRREEAESALRKDMFAAIFKEFFSGPGGSGKSAEKEKKDETVEERAERLSGLMLKLELLALNFGESLSLSPLFIEMDREIEDNQKDALWQAKRETFGKRLRSLARRVAERQLSALSTGGTPFEIDIPLARIVNGKSYTWPEALFMPPPEMWLDGKPPPMDDATTLEMELLSTIQCGETQKQFRITFSNADPERKTARVELEIYDVPGTDAAGGTHGTSLKFVLDFFNFPMIDNTRLTRNTRFALALTRFKIENIEVDTIGVVGICFPGFYASERDKPFLNEVLDDLRRTNARGVEVAPAAAVREPLSD